METIRSQQVGSATVRLLRMKQGFASIAFEGDKRIGPFEHEDPDVAWETILRELGKISPSYFGYDGARARFRTLFPDGFGGKPFQNSERDYKIAAHRLLLETMPIGKALQATVNDWEVVARVFSKTNMLSQFEQARTRDVLRGQAGAAFIRASAELAQGDLSALAKIADAFRTHGQFSWPAATYLPYLWRPESHMFLKPQVTKDFAERVGHPFLHDYSARPEPRVYESLLDLTAQTNVELAAHAPRDNIDVQSFIWVGGAYEGSAAVE